MLKKEELRARYLEEVESYEQVCLAGKALLRNALADKRVELLHVSHRVKSFESFFEKIVRKKIKDPFGSIEDICGLRVICFYINDLPQIGEIIGNTFTLRDRDDKSFGQDVDRFGYRSHHYSVHLPKALADECDTSMKLEIQTRTVLMHTWAHIQGRLEYKREEHTPRQFHRKLSQLSALLELVDEQFQSLKTEKEVLRESLISATNGFKSSVDLNIDTFMAFLESFFPHRRGSFRYSKSLLIALLENEIRFSEVTDGYARAARYIETIEKELEGDLRRDELLKLILAMTNQRFLESQMDDELIRKHLETIKSWSRTLARK